MNHTVQTCQQMASMTQTQILDEDKIDPFPARTTAELEEMLEACRRTKEILGRESLIYSKSADFSKYSDTELLAMSAFVRESCRMLAIILAGGAQHFWSGTVMSTLTELKNMYQYIDEKVKEFLLLDKVMDTLDVKLKYGRKVASTKSVCLSTHPDLNAFTALDATKGLSSEESLVRLAAVCEKFAEQCRTIAKTRVQKMDDRSRKVEVKEKLLVEMTSVLPGLRQHVLRIGMHKSQLQETNPVKCNGVGPGTHAHKITSLFSHKAVEEAHRSVEDCRERLMQEQLFRKAKVERRLEQEEEEDRLRTQRYPITELPAYSNLITSWTDNGTGSGRVDYNPDITQKVSSPESPSSQGPKSPNSPSRKSRGPKSPNSTSRKGRTPSPPLTRGESSAAAWGAPDESSRAKRIATESSPGTRETKGGTKRDTVPKGKASPKGSRQASDKSDGGGGSGGSSPVKSSSPKARGKARMP